MSVMCSVWYLVWNIYVWSVWNEVSYLVWNIYVWSVWNEVSYLVCMYVGGVYVGGEMYEMRCQSR